MLLAVLIMSLIALVAGLLLSMASRRLPAADSDLVARVDELLPQTQCGQCGFPGCRPYARAIVDNAAAINLCPPGGDATVRRIAALLGRDAVPLSEDAARPRVVAVIDESLCIGCTHCRTACPVDAITGAHQFMHTVIASECTGCELCVPRCPVDCIHLRSAA